MIRGARERMIPALILYGKFWTASAAAAGGMALLGEAVSEDTVAVAKLRRPNASWQFRQTPESSLEFDPKRLVNDLPAGHYNG